MRRLIHLLAKAICVLVGLDERLHHFGVDEVAVEVVQFSEPDVKTSEVIVGRGVGIAALGGAVLWAILGSGKGSASTAGVRVDVTPIAGGAELGIVGRY